MNALSERILEIATDYLGVGAKRFLDRQAAHLKFSSFEMLDEEHLEKFVWWVDVSAKLLLDRQRAAEFARKMADVSSRAKAPLSSNGEHISK